jgi:very-short-patch-repair endonuclease
MDASTTARPGRPAYAEKLDALLAEARTRLIETGTRNRLVHTNRRAKRPSTLAIVQDDSDSLFQRLVRDGASLRFCSDPRISARSGGEHEEVFDDDKPPALAAKPNNLLQTRVGEEALQRRLLKFYRDAKTLEEEQGINILYLAIGFLRWYEDEKSEMIREAPLILVPVSLARDTRRSTFELKAREEDVSTNLPLVERLKADFGISLPTIPEDDEWSPTEYFRATDSTIKSQRRWSIDCTGVELGFFSFSKFLMFHDLAGDAWENESILGHPLLRGLLLEGFAAEPPLFPDDTKIDERFRPSELIHVVDADGSQTLAIEAVRAGSNLVVQGPPGTGKSQTIANIIASAVHDGKSVLFIAEKMVALEVVRARLTAAGLGVVCLELHSRMANKRLVAEEFGRTLQSGTAAPNPAGEAEQLRKTRDLLNALCHRLHSPVGQSGMTPFKAIGDLVRAAGKKLPPPDLDLACAVDWDLTNYEHVRGVVQRLADLTRIAGRSDAHPWKGTRNLGLQPPDLLRLRERAIKLVRDLQELIKLASASAVMIARPAPATFSAIGDLSALLEEIKALPLGNAGAIRCLAALDPPHRTRAIEIAQIGIAAQAALVASGALFTKPAHQADLAPVRTQLARGIGSWLARLGGGYRRASAELGTWLTGALPKTASERVAIVDRLFDLVAKDHALSRCATEATVLFGALWSGERTDFSGIIRASEWLARAMAHGLGTSIEQALSLASRREIAARLPEKLKGDADRVRSDTLALLNTLDLDLAAAFGADSAHEIAVSALVDRFETWARGLDRYAEWAELSRLDAEVRATGAGGLADQIALGRLPPDRAVEELRHARAEALWKAAIKHDPELLRGNGEARSALVSEFKRLEIERRRAVAALIRTRHANAMPRGAMGEMAIIRGEIARKRGHMSIRKLIQRAGRTIQVLKPVFMMSPISVAQYLQPGAVTFDLVVIDEASQVRPEEALGVIARGSQIVVVGDRRQLPPTSFFSRLLAEENSDDEDGSIDAAPLAGAARATELESILTLCEARGLPSRMLRWHYRSRHPSLIEVSNAEFYRSSLFLPPAPTVDRGAQGLLLHRVSGAYDRGGKRTNAIEAQAIVDAAVTHAAEHPDQSLGVVTFSTAQRDLVSDFIEERRRTDPVLDAYLHSATEEVFVKNLENVQGDERDTILVSVGYGPRQVGGPLDSMNFGPVSSDGGERRLNVLFTRARHRCDIFVSFDSGDIDVSRATGEGPRILKRFLAYAATGVLDQPLYRPADYDSGFEEDVAGVIRSLGYPVDAQVGSAGFRIDLAVRDPDKPGRYVLAVECDGATYHGALWARERDRLRQEILEGLGWRFYRIWSTDWFHRREAELSRLKAALETARAAPPPTKSRPPPTLTTEQSAPLPLSAPVVERPPYRMANFAVRSSAEPHEIPLAQMADIVGRIVEIEGPIHCEEVGRRVASLFGKDRAGSRIAAAALSGLRHKRQMIATLHEDEGFWFTSGQSDICPVRDRSTAASSLQKADMLPPLEIRAAAMEAVKENGGIGRDDIAIAITRLLGFQRTGPDLRARVDGVVSRLLADSILQEENGSLRASR